MPRGVGCRGGARVPTHALFHGIRGRRGGVGGRRCFLLAISFVFHSRSDFVISLVCTFLGTGLADVNGELATCRHRADSGQETGCA